MPLPSINDPITPTGDASFASVHPKTPPRRHLQPSPPSPPVPNFCEQNAAAKVRPTTNFEGMYVIDISQDSETVVTDTRKDTNLPNSTTPRSEKNQGLQKVSNDTRT